MCPGLTVWSQTYPSHPSTSLSENRPTLHKCTHHHVQCISVVIIHCTMNALSSATFNQYILYDLLYCRSTSSSGSRDTDFPQSAAELQRKQHSVPGESDVRAPIQSFIKDDSRKPLPLHTSFKKPTESTQTPPQPISCLISDDNSSALYVDLDTDPKRKTASAITPPILAPRKSADDSTSTSSKMKRNSSDSHVSSIIGNMAAAGGKDSISPLHYAELDHSRAPTSPTLKAEPGQMKAIVTSGVDYTQVDHRQTEALALAKKKQ